MTIAATDIRVQGILGNEVRFTVELTSFGARLRLMDTQEGIYLETMFHQGVHQSHALVINDLLE